MAYPAAARPVCSRFATPARSPAPLAWLTATRVTAAPCRTRIVRRARPTPWSTYSTDKFKFDVAFRVYGIQDTAYNAKYSELDHLVPLELGGSNDATNLWPEMGKRPNPKDSVETALKHAVCKGTVTLAAAQQAIATNWHTAESTLGLG